MGIEGSDELRLATRSEYWLRHITAWKGSGSTATSYCRQHQLSLSRFTYWHYKLLPSDKKLKKPDVGFARVVTPVVLSEKPAEVTLDVGRYRLTLRDPIHTGSLRTVLDILEQRR